MDNDDKHDDDDAMIRRLQPRPSLSSRPLLIFNHNPKAGGGSVLMTIRGFKTNEIQSRSGNNRKETSGCQPNQWNRINRIISLSSNLNKNNNNSSSLSSVLSFSSNNNNNNTTDTINNTFIHIGEFSKTTAQDKERGYIIGTIREPCSQYVSLWSFGSFNNNGAFRNYQVRDTELYGQSPPYFNTTEDILRFHKWMNHPSVIGEIGRRVTVSYGNDDDDNENNNSNSIVNNVDCWVVVENFQQTLFDCLNRYENQGGYVDWTSKTLSQLKDKVQIQEDEENNNNNSHHHHHSRRYLGRDSRSHSREFKRFDNKGSKKRKNDHPKDDHPKDDPLGDPRLKHHASCDVFFATTTTTTTTTQNDSDNDNDNDNYDNYLIQQVMSPKNELFIYQQFGYDGCCTTNIPTINGNKIKSSNNNTETESTAGDSGGVSSSSLSLSSSPTRTTTTMNNASFISSKSSTLIVNKHNNTPTTTTTAMSESILISLLLAGGVFIMIYRLRGWIDNLSSCSSKQQRSTKSS